MVEIEQSAQTLPPLNVGGQAHRRWRSLQELVVESLVVSLAMVVVDVLAHAETQVPFAEGDDATETLLFNRADEPLGIRVEIGTLRRETDPAGTSSRACAGSAREPGSMQAVDVMETLDLARAKTGIDQVPVPPSLEHLTIDARRPKEGKCCNFVNGDGGRSGSRSQAATSNSLLMN